MSGRTAGSVAGMLGINTVAVFPAGETEMPDEGRVRVNTKTQHVRLVDPWPEYEAIVLDGEEVVIESVHINEGEFEQMVSEYGEVFLVPLEQTLWGYDVSVGDTAAEVYDRQE